MIRTIQTCVSTYAYFVQNIPSRTQPHLVYEVHSIMPDDPPYEYVCSCPGFRYNGHCAHQGMAWEDRCLWDESTGPEKQTPEQRDRHQCPRCGQDTYQEAVND